jgi:UDP-N-acetylglucosamine 4-epimerase
MDGIREAEQMLSENPRRWLVTGSAGFIGSNLVEHLLSLNQRVIGVDDYSTGLRRNTTDLLQHPNAHLFSFVEGSLEDASICSSVVREVDIVLHQAAVGSVPRSVADPMRSHRANVDAFLTLLIAAKDAKVARFVFASSSSVYGDSATLPKREEQIGHPLSPYAVTKYANELYADVFQRTYGIECIGLRYFNVFGRRQNPEGAYAAVIPRWVHRLITEKPCEMYGDGETTRDFCYIDNVIQANILAATAGPDATHRVFNIAAGQQTTLNEMFSALRVGLLRYNPQMAESVPMYVEERIGDIRHSLADISKAHVMLGYVPFISANQGVELAIEWYWRDAIARQASA